MTEIYELAIVYHNCIEHKHRFVCSHGIGSIIKID